MECKFVRQEACIKKRMELIDILWNVNKLNTKDIDTKIFELIDTLWNVNVEYDPIDTGIGYRINRYIMECKYNNNRCIC